MDTRCDLVTLSDINIELLIAICPRSCNTLMLLTDPLWVVSRRGAAAMNSTWFQFWLIKEFIRKKVDKELFITSFEFHTCWTFFLEMFELTFRHLVAETQKITSLKVTSFHNCNPLLSLLLLTFHILQTWVRVAAKNVHVHVKSKISKSSSDN